MSIGSSHQLELNWEAKCELSFQEERLVRFRQQLVYVTYCLHLQARFVRVDQELIDTREHAFYELVILISLHASYLLSLDKRHLHHDLLLTPHSLQLLNYVLRFLVVEQLLLVFLLKQLQLVAHQSESLF